MWRTVPTARLLLPFLMGIVGAHYLHAHPLTDRWLVPALMVCWLCLLPGWFRGQSARYRIMFGIGIWFWLILAGVAAYVQVGRAGSTRFPLNREDTGYLLLKIKEAEYRTGKSNRIWATLLANGPSRDSLYHNRQGILLYTRDSLTAWPGDTVLVRGSVRAVPPPRNPGAFNYQFYLFTRGVRYQVFVRDVYPLIAGRPRVSLYRFLQQWRIHLRQRLLAGIPSQSVAAVSMALIMGQKEALTEDMREAYARAGAMHVLAVSGLHVGIIAMLTQKLLGLFLPAGRHRRRLRVIGGILSVWGFALLTGAAASVLRASIMFSLFMLGQLYRTRAGVWNSILAAAFLMLWTNPLFIFQLSFQLSFSAVAGIVFFYPHLSRFLFPPGGVFNYIWQLLCVGLAAQFVTAPLTVYHFGQFPLLFWLSGWIVIPLAGITLGAGLLKILLSGIPVVGDLAGYILRLSVGGMNQAMQAIAGHPMAVVDQLSLPPPVVIAIYFSLLVAMVSWRFLPGWRVWSGWPVLLMLCAASHYQWSVHQQKMVVFYLVDDAFMADVIDGRQVLSICPESISEQARQYAASGFRQKRSLDHPREVNISKAAFIWIDASGLSIGWQCHAGPWPADQGSALDLLIVAGGAPPAGSNLLSADTQIFLGPGLSPQERARWLTLAPGQCQDLLAGRTFPLTSKKIHHERPVSLFSF